MFEHCTKKEVWEYFISEFTKTLPADTSLQERIKFVNKIPKLANVSADFGSAGFVLGVAALIDLGTTLYAKLFTAFEGGLV